MLSSILKWLNAAIVSKYTTKGVKVNVLMAVRLRGREFRAKIWTKLRVKLSKVVFFSANDYYSFLYKKLKNNGLANIEI